MLGHTVPCGLVWPQRPDVAGRRNVLGVCRRHVELYCGLRIMRRQLVRPGLLWAPERHLAAGGHVLAVRTRDICCRCRRLRLQRRRVVRRGLLRGAWRDVGCVGDLHHVRRRHVVLIPRRDVVHRHTLPRRLGRRARRHEQRGRFMFVVRCGHIRDFAGRDRVLWSRLCGWLRRADGRHLRGGGDMLCVLTRYVVPRSGLGELLGDGLPRRFLRPERPGFAGQHDVRGVRRRHLHLLCGRDLVHGHRLRRRLCRR